jgi:pSer/pThr/pTyr-binding forkhead associated (FHA) protein
MRRSHRGSPLQLLGEVEGRGVVVRLGQGRHRVGSAADNEVVLPDLSVSRHHALLVVRADESLVEDLGSRNGTFVNGTSVERSVLRDGDLVHFGVVGFSVGRASADEVDLAMEVACVLSLLDEEVDLPGR